MSKQAPPSPEKQINPWSVYGLAIIIALGFVVGWNYLVFQSKRELNAMSERRLPMLSRLDSDIKVTSSQGETFFLGDKAKGKVLVTSYLYTRCPSGCAGIAADMKALQDEFGDDANFQLLSVSLDPENDDPAALKQFKEQYGFTGENWLFLTGEKNDLSKYMERKFLFVPPQSKPEEERLFEGDLYVHDMRVALADHKGNVRGFYAVVDPMARDIHIKNLRTDIKRLLKEAKQ